MQDVDSVEVVPVVIIFCLFVIHVLSEFQDTLCVNFTRRVSDEVFDESFGEFFIPTEDYSTAAKLTGLGNTRKLFKIESFRGPQQG
jgi:hypothetical protein